MEVERRKGRRSFIGVPRTLTQIEQFNHGAIRRIRLKNFLTFDDVEMFPCPKLNVIVGPNGTGKSSIVCGICLGLAGQTKLLGRAKELKEFYKHGAQEPAYIEIELHDKGGNHPCIRREFRKGSNSSKWFIQQREVREQEVVSLVQGMRIQLDNKCQFLPQDMVVEFAKLDSYRMLEETERAIGSSDLFRLHQELKDLKKDKERMEMSRVEHQRQLDDLVRANRLMERDVRRIRTRKECLDRIRYLRFKKSWMVYEEVRQEYVTAKAERKLAEQRRSHVHRTFQPLRDKLQENETIVLDFLNIEKEWSRRMLKVQGLVLEKTAELDQLADEIEASHKEFSQRQEEEQQRLFKIRRTESEVQSFQNQLGSLPAQISVQPLISEKIKQMTDLQDQLGRLQMEQKELAEEKLHFHREAKKAAEELKSMDNIRNQRLQKLRARDRETEKALVWLEGNRDLFQESVFAPVLVLVSIRNMHFASHIEHFFMTGRDAFSFITLNKHDYELFLREVRDKMRLRVNAVISPQEPLSSFSSSLSPGQLRSFGFEHVLLDLLEAPEPVLSYFCARYYLHQVPVASGMSNHQVDQFIGHQSEIQRFYVGNLHYSVRRSRYRQNKTITTSQQIMECQFLIASVDESRRKVLVAEIQATESKMEECDCRLRQLGQEETQMRQKDSRLRREKNELRESINTRARLQRNIDQKQIQIDRLKQSPIDLTVEEQKMKDIVRKCHRKRVKCVEKLSEYGKASSEHLLGKMKSHLNLVEAEKKRDLFQSRVQDVTNELKEAEEECKHSKQNENELKERAKAKMEEAQRLTGYLTPQDFPPELADMFSTLPDTVEEVEERISENQAQADLNLEPGENSQEVVALYERREDEIEKLMEMISREVNKLQHHSSSVMEKKTRWLNPLQELMEKINYRFGRYFSQMNCAGEVSLLSDESDFSKFGVQIRVKFRPEDELHVLDAHRQSGGERSVSTMMYLMALQDISSCPFRVVDEINQGMDSSNERRVFDLIVDTVSSVGTSQYFLLTPKLLQDLHYTESVKVHCVCNGQEMMHHSDWNIERFLA